MSTKTIHKIMGIDFGFKRVGLALADNQTKIAVPYKILENKGADFLLLEIKNIIQQENIQNIVIGLPKSLKSQHLSQQAQKTKKFIDFLQTNLNIPINIFDERLTTKLARTLKHDTSVKNPYQDDLAAQIILHDYLERCARS